MKIPLYKPYVSKEETKAVLRVLKSRKLSRGGEVVKFEKNFSRYIGKKHAIAVNSGTSGLHVLVRSMGWGEGDEVITTPYSYVASSNALLFEKVMPVFVDINSETLNIDPKKIESKISEKTKGMLLVDILGLPVDYDELVKIKNKYKFQIIEDACEAIGKPDKDFSVGKIADATVYGFHENKQITTGGEGGMIVTDNDEIAEKCKAMRDQGRSLKKDWINNVTLGFNFRMTEVQSAFGIEQLKKVDKIIKKRESIAQKYFNEFKDIKGIKLPCKKNSKRSWFFYYIILESSEIRDRVYNFLLKNGISSSKNYFPPIYDFPMYKGHNKDCKNTEVVSKTLLVLPMFYEMNFKQVKQVVTCIKKALK